MVVFLSVIIIFFSLSSFFCLVLLIVVFCSGVADAFVEIGVVSLQLTAHVHDQLSAVGRRPIGRIILPSQVSGFVV